MAQEMFDQVIASLHEAMLGHARWLDASSLIDDVCALKGTHLVMVDEHPKSTLEWTFDQAYYRGQLREELRKEYVNDFFPHDERIPRMLRMPDSRVFHVTDLFTESELKTSPTYNDLLPRADGQNALNIRMDGPDGSHIVWAIADPVHQDGWRSDQIDMIKALLPHVRQYVRVRHALAGARALGETMTALLENSGVGVICLDWRGMIAANDLARRILSRCDGLSDQGGLLRARLAAEDSRLQRMLARAVGQLGGGGQRAVR